jgi:hypothetical protein
MSDQPKEEKNESNFLDKAKDDYRAMNFMNSSAFQNAQVAALIFIGEQLAEHNKLSNMIVVDLDNLTRTWGKTE